MRRPTKTSPPPNEASKCLPVQTPSPTFVLHLFDQNQPLFIRSLPTEAIVWCRVSLSILFNEGAENAFLNRLNWKHLPKKKGAGNGVSSDIKMNDLIPGYINDALLSCMCSSIQTSSMACVITSWSRE